TALIATTVGTVALPLNSTENVLILLSIHQTSNTNLHNFF
ncbi:MAG: hypothetical protein ACI90V_010966, partial [Bacillariaceae sp.]